MHNVDCTTEISPKKLILMRLGDQHGWCFREIETAKCSVFSLIKFLKGAHWNFNLISSFHAVNRSFSSYAFGFKMNVFSKDDYAVSYKPAEGLNSIIKVKLLNSLSIKSINCLRAYFLILLASDMLRRLNHSPIQIYPYSSLPLNYRASVWDHWILIYNILWSIFEGPGICGFCRWCTPCCSCRKEQTNVS